MNYNNIKKKRKKTKQKKEDVFKQCVYAFALTFKRRLVSKYPLQHFLFCIASQNGIFMKMNQFYFFFIVSLGLVRSSLMCGSCSLLLWLLLLPLPFARCPLLLLLALLVAGVSS